MSEAKVNMRRKTILLIDEGDELFPFELHKKSFAPFPEQINPETSEISTTIQRPLTTHSASRSGKETKSWTAS